MRSPNRDIPFGPGRIARAAVDRLRPDAKRTVHSISIYDGLVAIEKRARERGTFCGMPPIEDQNIRRRGSQ